MTHRVCKQKSCLCLLFLYCCAKLTGKFLVVAGIVFAVNFLVVKIGDSGVIFCGGCVSPVSEVAGLSCGGHRRRGCWCSLLTGISAWSVIAGGSVVVDKVVGDLGIVAGVIAEDKLLFC